MSVSANVQGVIHLSPDVCLCMCAGYTIHTVVQLAHAGLLPLEHQAPVQQAFAQLAPALSTSADTITALMDKSLPTMIGLGGRPCVHE